MTDPTIQRLRELNHDDDTIGPPPTLESLQSLIRTRTRRRLVFGAAIAGVVIAGCGIGLAWATSLDEAVEVASDQGLQTPAVSELSCARGERSALGDLDAPAAPGLDVELPTPQDAVSARALLKDGEMLVVGTKHGSKVDVYVVAPDGTARMRYIVTEVSPGKWTADAFEVCLAADPVSP